LRLTWPGNNEGTVRMSNDERISSSGQPSIHKRRLIAAGVVVCVIVAVSVTISYGRHYVLPKRFFEVAPGQIYRSGEMEKGPFLRVLDKHQIKTILTLLNREPGDPDQEFEEEVVAEKGIKLIRIGMPGNGIARFDDLDEAAAILADSSTHPLLVHCSAGVNRTGAVVAAWRMKYCGWTLEDAIEEADRCGWSPRRNPEMRDHLQEYYQTRVVKK
jgi:protein-tyrosine phosphatase